MMRNFLFTNAFLSALFVTLTASQSANALSCMRTTQEAEFEKADAVIIATVLDREDILENPALFRLAILKLPWKPTRPLKDQ